MAEIIYLNISTFRDFRTMEDRIERFEAKINLSFNRLSSKIDSQQASIDYLTTLIERLAQQVFWCDFLKNWKFQDFLGFKQKLISYRDRPITLDRICR